MGMLDIKKCNVIVYNRRLSGSSPCIGAKSVSDRDWNKTIVCIKSII